MNGLLSTSNNTSLCSDSESFFCEVCFGRAVTRVAASLSPKLTTQALRGRSRSTVCGATVITPVSESRESDANRPEVLATGTDLGLSRGEVWTAL